MDANALASLIAELGRKTSICWIGYDEVEHPAWHVWHADALLVVSGGDEQRLPGIEAAETVTVTMRSKDDRSRQVTWVGVATTIAPESDDWADAVRALVSQRLSLPSPSDAPALWAEQSVVTRILPTGETLEAPGSLSRESHVAPPLPTAATTRLAPWPASSSVQ